MRPPVGWEVRHLRQLLEGKSATGLRDAELLEVVKKQLPETERISAWAKSRCKLAAPQVLAG